jgi:DNA-binding NarL/FixJ family response regulator
MFAMLRLSSEILVDVLSGDLQRARRSLEEQLEPVGVVGSTRSIALTRLAEVEVEVGDMDAALRLLREIDDSGRPQDHGSFVRCRLVYGRATGDLDALREAAAVADEHGLALLRGLSHLYLGIAGDDTEENLHAAIRIFQSLDATPWRRRAAAELRQRGMKVPRHRLPGSKVLTETEMQIARLVQLERPNREIAMTVYLSVKTVEAYLSRIYAKTGCSSRLELARALDRGLLA